MVFGSPEIRSCRKPACTGRYRRESKTKKLFGSIGTTSGCLDIWELSNGDFAVIGIRKTRELLHLLPKSAGCGLVEEIVLVPRIVIANAKRDLPDYHS